MFLFKKILFVYTVICAEVLGTNLKLGFKIPAGSSVSCSFHFVQCFVPIGTQYNRAPGSFIFSLKNNDNLPPFQSKIMSGRDGYAVYRDFDHGPTFGGSDIRIIEDPARSYTASRSNFGHTYETPPGYAWPNPKAFSLLAGSHQFVPTECEVFYERQ